MKTSYLQSQLARNASQITFFETEKKAQGIQAHAAYEAENQALLDAHVHVIHWYRRSINKLAELQKAIKADLKASRTRRPPKKHSKAVKQSTT